MNSGARMSTSAAVEKPFELVKLSRWEDGKTGKSRGRIVNTLLCIIAGLMSTHLIFSLLVFTSLAKCSSSMLSRRLHASRLVHVLSLS